MTEHRCLAVRQPWAWALVAGLKGYENRSWSTDYRGPVLVLASASKTLVNHFVKADGLDADHIEFGAFIGVVDLLDVVPLSKELESDPWVQGAYCWRVGNARVFDKPLPFKGKLNLFTLPGAQRRAIETRLESAKPAQPISSVDAWVRAV